MSNCMTIKGGDRIRITEVDGCGRPVYGECKAVVTKGIVEFKISPEVEEGEAKEQKNFAGEFCFSEPTADQIKYWTVEMTWCEINLTAFKFMNPSYEIIENDEGEVIGYYASNTLDTSKGYAVEVWVQLAGDAGDVCTGSDESSGVWGYIPIPWITGGTPGEITIGGEDSVTFTSTGKTKSGSKWGKGPYAVLLDGDGVPVPLPKAIGSDVPFAVLQTTARPPEVDCDCVEVERPVPPVADLVIDGLPKEDPRNTVNLRVDNHGFGPVTVDWGDGKPVEEVADLRKVSHKYESDGEKTIKVCDKQDTDICVTKKITIPLADDKPVLKLTCNSARPLTGSAEITVPAQADGRVWIDWGDGSPEQMATADAGTGKVTVTHLYTKGGQYSVTVRRADKRTYRDRKTQKFPCAASSGPEGRTDGLHAPTMLALEEGPGYVTLTWKD